MHRDDKINLLNVTPCCVPEMGMGLFSSTVDLTLHPTLPCTTQGDKSLAPNPSPLSLSLSLSLIYPLTLGSFGHHQWFRNQFPIFFPFSTALWDLANSRPVHSLMLSSHFFLCLPCLLPPFTVPCKMVSARPHKRKTWPYHCSLRFFTVVRRSSCGPFARWILARTSSLGTWSFVWDV